MTPRTQHSDSAAPIYAPSRTFTQEQLRDKAVRWMKDHYKERNDEYYTRLGIMLDFVTDLVPKEGE
jgi:hypothetical protein